MLELADKDIKIVIIIIFHIFKKVEKKFKYVKEIHKIYKNDQVELPGSKTIMSEMKINWIELTMN